MQFICIRAHWFLKEKIQLSLCTDLKKNFGDLLKKNLNIVSRESKIHIKNLTKGVHHNKLLACVSKKFGFYDLDVKNLAIGSKKLL